MAEEKYEMPRSPVRSLDDGVVLSYVVRANTRPPSSQDPPPPYSPEPKTSAQVATKTVTPTTASRSSLPNSRKKSCRVVVAILIIAVLILIGFLTYYYHFRKTKEPPIEGDIEKPAFYANVSSLRSKINLNLKFPAGILSNLDGKQKVAIVFLRQEFRSGKGLFQVAMLSFGNPVANLSTLVASSAQFMLRTASGVDFYFDKYPVVLHMEAAVGAYDQKKFIWGSSISAIFHFESKADGEKPLSLKVGKPNKAAKAIVDKIVKQAGWTEVKVSESKNKEDVKAQVTPGCNANYYLNDCSRYCLAKNSSDGHYTCVTDGRKKCLDGWLNPDNNCLDVDYCASTNCLNGGTCQNTNRTALCICQKGFTGEFCGKDIDECSNGTRCFNGGTCQNTNGSFKCFCSSNFRGTDCSTDVNECLRFGLCQNGGTCRNVHGSYECECIKPFRGKHCQITAASTVKPSTILSFCFIVALLLFR